MVIAAGVGGTEKRARVWWKGRRKSQKAMQPRMPVSGSKNEMDTDAASRRAPRRLGLQSRPNVRSCDALHQAGRSEWASEWTSLRRPDRCDQTTARWATERRKRSNTDASGACKRSHKH